MHRVLSSAAARVAVVVDAADTATATTASSTEAAPHAPRMNGRIAQRQAGL